MIEASVTFSGWMCDVLLGLERLVQAFGIAPALHHAAGELVDDDDLVVLDDVVLVLLEQLVRAQRLIDVVDDRDVVDVVEVAFLERAGRAQQLDHVLVAVLGQRHLRAASRRARNPALIEARNQRVDPAGRVRNGPRSDPR